MQPLDVAVFGPLKKQWKQILNRWFRESRLQSVTKEVFAGLLKQLCEHVSEQHAIVGFRVAGLWPINKEIVLKKRVDVDGDILEESVETTTSAIIKAIKHVIAPVPSGTYETKITRTKTCTM